jgi:hypothetical protein
MAAVEQSSLPQRHDGHQLAGASVELHTEAFSQSLSSCLTATLSRRSSWRRRTRALDGDDVVAKQAAVVAAIEVREPPAAAFSWSRTD